LNNKLLICHATNTTTNCATRTIQLVKRILLTAIQILSLVEVYCIMIWCAGIVHKFDILLHSLQYILLDYHTLSIRFYLILTRIYVNT
jgi:hypothetical protein